MNIKYSSVRYLIILCIPKPNNQPNSLTLLSPPTLPIPPLPRGVRCLIPFFLDTTALTGAGVVCRVRGPRADASEFDGEGERCTRGDLRVSDSSCVRVSVWIWGVGVSAGVHVSAGVSVDVSVHVSLVGC